MAFNLTQKLNTEKRRDHALLDFVEAAIQLPTDKLDLIPIQNAVNHFTRKELKGEAIFKVVTRLSRLSKKIGYLPESLMNQALFFINSINEILESEKRCHAYCLAYKLLIGQDASRYSGLVSSLLNKLDTTWRAIDRQWIKVDVGFSIAKSLAEHTSEKAQDYLDFSKQFRDECILDTETSALAYLHSLLLTIRAYSGLLPKHIDTPEDLEILTELIDLMPSYGEQTRLWAELALRLAINGRLNECEHIVADHIKPLLGKITDEDIRYQSKIVITVAPALYRAHPVTALERISNLPRHEKDKAYVEICNFLLWQHPPSDPYDQLASRDYKNVTYENMVNICELLNLMEHDAQINHFIECIADAIVFCRDRSRFSNEQKLDIARRLEEIGSKKFPDLRNIRHDGYKIVNLAQIARIKGMTHTKVSRNDWENLIRMARKIPNLADRPLVLCMVAIAMPTKEAKLRRETLEEAMELVKQMPSSLDRVSRYAEFAEMVRIVDPGISKNCLKLAMGLATTNEDPEFYSFQRRIIDIAHQLDEDFAASLARLSDDDPARAKTKMNLQDHLQVLKLRKQMAELSSDQDLSTKLEDDYSRAAWMNLGALNAGRIVPVHFEKTRPFIYVAAGLPFSESYPILAWVIGNAVGRLANTDQARTYLRALYEATLLGTRLTERMAARSSKQLEQALNYTARLSSSNSVIILGREKEKAIQFLRNWFANTVRDYLKIHDPYFGPEDLEILQLLSLENPSCRVEILTSQEHHQKQMVPEPWEKAYRDYWRTYISEYQKPPDTEIVIVGLKSGKSPIHERWWLTNGAGIRVGTSFNGLGGVRISEISYLSKEEVEIRQKIIDDYLYGRKREHEGERLNRWQFPLLL